MAIDEEHDFNVWNIIHLECNVLRKPQVADYVWTTKLQNYLGCQQAT